MKKVVFKGIINGQEFDNVQDYNKMMNELVESGSTIEASSSTRVDDEVETFETVNHESQKANGNKELFDLNRVSPYFGKDVDDYYLDKLVTGDNEIDAIRLQSVKEEVEKTYNDLKEALDIDDFDIDDVLDAMNKYKCIRDQILEDKYVNEESTQEVKNRIKADSEKLKVLENAHPVIDTLLDCYTGLFNALKNYILS